MQFETVSHATLLLTPKDQAAPLLATDPWLFGSCYWRSWWLSNPPSEETIRRIGQSRFIYLTHEHPDHFHVPTLRRLAPKSEPERESGPGPTILVPDFLNMQMDAFLREELGYRVERLAPDSWRELGEGVRVMSLPYPNNDSVLLVDTPQALLIDLNDVKPSRGFLARVGAQVRRIDKPRIALRSYSLAGPSNSYFVDGERKPRLAAKNFVMAAQGQSSQVGAHYFVPFASQAIFRRSDSAWANDFKVDYAALRHYWSGAPELLPPYIHMDLDSFDYDAPDPRAYAQTPFTERQRAHVAEAEAREHSESLTADDMVRLRKVLNEERFAMLALFPSGIAFRVSGRRLVYDPRTGRIADSERYVSAQVDLPVGPFRDAVALGHFSDLFIGLFGKIHMDHEDAIGRFSLLYKILFLRDYGYGGVLKRLRWAVWAWRRLHPRVPLPPAPA